MQNLTGSPLENLRYACFKAYCDYLQKGVYLHLGLDRYLSSASLKDRQLAQEITLNTCRFERLIDFYIGQTCKLPRRKKERALIRQAFYQWHFLDKIPTYALCNETVNIAKKEISKSFSAFLNRWIQKLETYALEEPQEDGIQYSFPDYFVQQLGIDKKNILPLLNQVPPLTARKIGSFDFTVLKGGADLQQKASSKLWYIQNKTPALLMQHLYQDPIQPKKILDIAASPGGKLLLAHELYPQAALVANDISLEKKKLLQENIKKYGLNVALTQHLGQEFPIEETFDLIVCDLPCSNTGVLHKRPEARWRLSKENTEQLCLLQLAILTRMAKVLAKNGSIWYLTCSILQKENEALTDIFCAQCGFTKSFEKTILPDAHGLDGGYGCVLKKN